MDGVAVGQPALSEIKERCSRVKGNAYLRGKVKHTYK